MCIMLLFISTGASEFARAHAKCDDKSSRTDLAGGCGWLEGRWWRPPVYVCACVKSRIVFFLGWVCCVCSPARLTVARPFWVVRDFSRWNDACGACVHVLCMWHQVFVILFE